MNYIQIMAAVFFAILLILSFAFFSTLFGKERDSKDIIRSMTLDAMFIAIILLMTFVPNLGFIAVTPFISFTLMHLPVLLGAALGGPKKGALYGLAFGIASYVNALSSAGFNALFAFPWVAIPPRVVFGLLAGIVFSLMEKLSKKRRNVLYLSLCSAGLTMVHTILVFLDLYVFFPEQVGGLLASTDPVGVGTKLTFLLLILIGMAGEMAIAAFIIPPLYLATSHFRKTKKKKKT